MAHPGPGPAVPAPLSCGFGFVSSLALVPGVKNVPLGSRPPEYSATGPLALSRPACSLPGSSLFRVHVPCLPRVDLPSPRLTTCRDVRGAVAVGNGRAVPPKSLQGPRTSQQAGPCPSTQRSREQSPGDTRARLRPSQPDTQRPEEGTARVSTAGRVSKRRGVRPYDGTSSALTRKEVLTHPSTGMNLEDVMLSETSQPAKQDQTDMIPLSRGTYWSQGHRDREQNGGCRGWGRGGRGVSV